MNVKRSSVENYFLFHTNRPKNAFPGWKNDQTFFNTFQDSVGTLFIACAPLRFCREAEIGKDNSTFALKRVTVLCLSSTPAF